MFTDLKNIEEEINRFKRNMDTVDGLMSATKEVCGKMDHQINQAEQVLANFSSFRQEQSEDMQNFTQQITNEMTQIDERFTSNQQETQQSLEKQKLELKQLIENLANNQQLLQQSLEQQAKDTDNIAAKAKARYIRLTVITVIGFLILGILLIVT